MSAYFVHESSTIHVSVYWVAWSPRISEVCERETWILHVGCASCNKKGGFIECRVAYAKMADEISSLLLAESRTGSLETNTEMKMFDIVLDAPLPEDVRMCRLQGAVEAFTKLIGAEIPA